MRSGRLRHRVRVQKPGGSRNTFGERVTTWTTVADDYASVEPLRGQETFLAAQQNLTVTHRIRLRYRSAYADLDNSWRVLFGDRVLLISIPRNIDERNREFELLCLEGKAQE